MDQLTIKEQKKLLNKALRKHLTKAKVSVILDIYPQHFNRYYLCERMLPLDKYLKLKKTL